MGFQEEYTLVKDTFKDILTTVRPFTHNFPNLLRRAKTKIRVGGVVPTPYGMNSRIIIELEGKEYVASATALWPGIITGMQVKNGKITYSLRDHPDHSDEWCLHPANIDLVSGVAGKPEPLLELVPNEDGAQAPPKVIEQLEDIFATHYIIRKNRKRVFDMIPRNHSLEHKNVRHAIMNPHPSSAAVAVFLPRKYDTPTELLHKVLMADETGLDTYCKSK